MTVQTLYATSLVSGTVASAANALGQPDGTWTTDTGNVNWTARWAIGDPVNVVGANGTHSFVARVRKEVGQSNNPTAQLIVYSGGTQIGSSANTTITGTTDLTVNIAAANITNLTNVEMELVTVGAGGSPSARSSAQVDALWWTGDFTPQSPPVAISASDTSSISIADSGSWEEYVPPDDPTLMYEVSFDEGVGSTASSTGVIATLSPIPSWVAIGKNGAAMEVDPIQGHAPPQTVSSSTNPLSEYTIMAWWKVADVGISGNALFSSGNIGNVTVDNFGELAWAQNFQTIFAENPLSTGTYYHIAITGSPTLRELFVNGVSVGTLATPALAYEGNMLVGGSGSTNGANHVDDFRLYSRVLTPSEIQSAMNTAATLPEQEQPEGIHVASSSIEELSTGTSISVPKPSVVADGDVLFASIHFTGTTLPTAPSGFQLYGSVVPSSVIGVAVYYKVVSSAATEPTSYTWSGMSSGRITGIVTSYRGVDNTNPLDVATMNSADNQTSGSVIVPGITTTTDGAALVGAAVQNNSTGSVTVPSGWTRTAHSAGGLGRTGAAGYFIQPAAGDIGSQTWTFESTTLAHGVVMGALRPASDTGTTTEPIAGTDTASIGITETSSLVISRTVSTSDAASISVSESTSRFVTKSASDAATLAITEIANASKNMLGTETIALGVVEQAQIFKTSSASDTGAISLTESSTILGVKEFGRSDTGSLSVSESAQIEKRLTVTDTAALSVSESRSLNKSTATTDNSVLSVVESVHIYVTQATTDTASLSVSDSVFSGSDASASDAGALAVSEASALVKSITSTDTSGLAIADSTIITKTISATDQGSLVITEVGSNSGTMPGNETIAIGVAEEVSIYVTNSTTDTLTLGSTDAGGITLTAPQSASDSDGLAVIESALITKTIDSSDTATINVTEDTGSFVSVQTTDTTGLSVAESRLVDATHTRTDDSGLAVDEDINIFVEVESADHSHLRVYYPKWDGLDPAPGDGGSDDGFDVSEQASDSGSLAVQETSSITATEATATMYVYTGGVWKQGQLHIYINGEWRPVTINIFANGGWI